MIFGRDRWSLDALLCLRDDTTAVHNDVLLCLFGESLRSKSPFENAF